MKKILLIIGLLLLTGCCNKDDAYNALHSAGYTNVKITSYHWFACSDDDFYHTGFIATNIRNERVSGTVCSGLFFKNSTIRF